MALLLINIVFSILGLTALVWGVFSIRKLDKETQEIFDEAGIEIKL